MIRQAVLGDVNNIAELIISGWQSAYRGLIDNEFLDNMSLKDLCKGWKRCISQQNSRNCVFVYVKSDEILGIIRFGVPDNLDDTEYNAEIHVLYVEPDLKRHGIGTKLFNFAKDYFIKNCQKDLIVWCLKDNSPSIKFYEKMGGTITATRSSIVHNIQVEEVGITYKL